VSELAVEIVSGMDVALAVGAVVAVGSNVGRACSVCKMAAETVPATMVSTRLESAVGANTGAEAVGSPGSTQAVIVAKKIIAMKNVRLLFMVFFPYQVV